MGKRPRGNVAGKRIVPLPTFNQNNHLPWPSFDVNLQARKSVSNGQTPYVFTLSALPPATITNPAANPPRISVPPKAPPTMPQNAKRTAGPVSASTQQGTVAPASPASPATAHQPPATTQTPAWSAYGSPVKPTQPKRTAGPITHPSVPPVTPYAQPLHVPVVPAAVAGKPTSSSVHELAKAAYILGWLTILLGLFAGIPAIICGHLALRRANLSLTPEQVKRKALIGLTLGYILSILWLLLIIWIMSS